MMSVPVASAVAMPSEIWTDPEAPAASAPIGQVTTPAESVPLLVADTNVVFAGTVSETIRPEERRVGKEDNERMSVIVPTALIGKGTLVAGRDSNSGHLT